MKKASILLVAALVSVMAFVGCKSNDTKEANTTEATTASYKEMTGEELDKIQEDKEEKEKYLVIDVRSKEEYEAGHVKFAINIPLDELDSRMSEIEDYKSLNIVTICNTGKKSAEAAKKLVEAGYANVYNAQGVKDFKYTTITKVNTILPAEVKEKVASGDYTVIDLQDEKDYVEGHMKKAIHANMDTFETEMEALPTDKPFLTYCYKGNRSWSAAEMLSQKGYQVYTTWDGTKEYDGYELEK